MESYASLSCGGCPPTFLEPCAFLCVKLNKRSFFVTGYLNFRKYKSSDRYCDWVESCNMLMHRELFIKNKGMNKNIYLGEDKELIERMKKNDTQEEALKIAYDFWSSCRELLGGIHLFPMHNYDAMLDLLTDIKQGSRNSQ